MLLSALKQWGPVALIVGLVVWRTVVVIKRWVGLVGEKVGKVVDRHLAAFDAMGERLHRMGNRIQQHSEADAEVVAAVARLEGKMDQALSDRRIEPEDDTPPLGSPVSRRTPRPGAYGLVRRPTKDDSDDSGG